MKLTILLTTLIFSLPTRASFYAKCVYEAQVVSIKQIATLNVPVNGDFRTGKNNYSNLMELKLDKGVAEAGSHVQNCEKKIVQTLIKDKKLYKPGQNLKITITEMNSRGGGFSYSISTK